MRNGRYESHPPIQPIARLTPLICRGPHAPVSLSKMHCDEALNASQRECGHATNSPFSPLHEDGSFDYLWKVGTVNSR